MKAKILMTVLLLLCMQLALAETPTNNSIISNSTPDFSWGLNNNSSINHTLMVDNSSDFSDPEVDKAGIENTSYTLSSALADGEFYWKANNTEGDSTGTYSFTLDTTPPQPGNVTINDGEDYTSSENLDLNWSGFTDENNIEHYYYNYSDNSGTREGINTTSTEDTLSNEREGNISIHVWAEDSAGNIGNAASDWIVADYTPPSFTNWQENPNELTYSTSGDFEATFDLVEDNPNATPQCRYKIGSTADYNSWEDTTDEGSQTYSYTISADWEANAGQTLYYECSATDLLGHSNSTEREKDILDNQYSPEFTKAEDQYAVEDNLLNFNLQAQDQDGDALTFSTSHDEINISSINETAANVEWKPRNEDVGNHSVDFTVTDGEKSTTTSIRIQVNNSNDPPELQEIPDIDAYLHEPVSAYFLATDPDNQNSADFDDQTSPVFTADKDWFQPGDELKSGINFTSDGEIVYIGRLNFTPLLSHKGKHNVTIKVTDEGSKSDTESFILDVGYCGDTDAAGQPKCDSDYEDCESCPKDCGKCSVQESDAMALLTPDRNCLYTNVTVSAYKLYKRATCKDQGKIINGKEVCDPIDGATIILYELVNEEWKEKKELVTSSKGKVSFIPEEEGDYKLVGEYQGYRNANKFMEFRECIDVQRNKSNQSEENEEKTNEQDEQNNEQSKQDDKQEQKEPGEEKPGEVEPKGEKVEEASTVEIILYYIIIPVLFALLIFVLFLYYEKEKNRNPKLLKFRIWLLKKKKALFAWIGQYWHKIRG